MRTRARADVNQPEIVAALKACGWKVRNIKWPTDLLIVKPGRQMLLAEVKRDAKAKLTPDQLDAIEDGFQVVVLRSLEDVQRISS